jgi:hypothetical protein
MRSSRIVTSILVLALFLCTAVVARGQVGGAGTSGIGKADFDPRAQRPNGSLAFMGGTAPLESGPAQARWKSAPGR